MDALHGPGAHENITLKMESRVLSIRNRISEDVARSELEATERDARCALFYQYQQFKIAVREYQKIGERYENYEVMTVQEFQGIQNRYQGRMEENVRRVAQVIGTSSSSSSRRERERKKSSSKARWSRS